MADWNLQGDLLGACSCDWGCPCSFNARPTQGWCEGGYVWHVRDGSFDGTSLRGVTFAWLGRSPGPMHEGNVTAAVVVDERATPEQRRAIEELTGGKHGGPWTIFAAITATRLPTAFAPFEFNSDGLRSSASAGDVLREELAPILNPVTGAAEELQLRKPTGFTSKWADLGTTSAFRVQLGALAFDHTGKYGEYSQFEYAGA